MNSKRILSYDKEKLERFKKGIRSNLTNTDLFKVMKEAEQQKTKKAK